MKKRILFILVALTCVMSVATAQAPVGYDSALAHKTGADDYGMKPYVLAFLKKGTASITDKAKSNELLMGHMKNISKLAEEGKMVVAGPMMDNTGLEGIFIFNVKTVAEAEVLSQSDPAVKAGLFAMEYHPWYATAALMEVVRIHKTLEKKKRG